MKTFVMGDIHGAHKALTQCFQRSGFNRGVDRLIVLGDVCDVYPEVKECVEELLNLPHCALILGNHDSWAIEWSLRGTKSAGWLKQGGEATIRSYEGGPIPKKHFDFLSSAHLWLELDGRLYVHAGFRPDQPLDDQRMQTLTMDRSMVEAAWQEVIAGQSPQFGSYQEVYVGHTPTQAFDAEAPLQLGNLWLMDTGAGWTGKLSILDVETKQFWQSDSVVDLYGRVPGARIL